MDPNVERLLRLVTEAREARGLSKQTDFIKATGLGKTTIYRFERGEQLSDTAYRSVDWALGWQAGSCLAILEGGEPTPSGPADRSQRVLHEGDMDPSKPLSERLPTSVMHALEGREVYATDTYDLTLGGGLTLVAVVVRDPDAPGHPKDFERLRRENRAWLNAQHKLRNLPPLEWEPGDPEEWKADSGSDNT